MRFGMVAGSCTLLQLLILEFLNRRGVNRVLANGIGFVISAQVNFTLSALFTWRDRKPLLAKHTKSLSATKAGVWVARWAKFNITALVALAINEVVFAAALHAGAALIMGSAAGILTGAVVTFSVNHFVTFRDSARETAQPGIAESLPSLAYVRAKVQGEGVAFFLPAFNEAVNLRILVPKLVQYFHSLDCPFTVIIVDDGSTRDDTYETAERMAEAYNGYVHVVHHNKNMGYGAAIQTGLRTALGTGHGLIAFCDADNQFDVESFGTLLTALQDENADLAVGYRIVRADSLKRRMMGSLWHWLSTHVLDFGDVHDVDCGFKIFTRQVLSDIVPCLDGDYATVSPEILARATAAGYTIAEAGVTHKPRTSGRQTGSDLKVVALSLVHLIQLRATLRKEQQSSAQLIQEQAAIWVPEPRRTRDPVAWVIGLVAAVLSLSAYVVTDRAGAVLTYTDSISHMEIARRVLSSTSPGLAQLGAVWLPLPHVLMLPFVWDTTLYHNGLAGTIPSLIAYVANVVLIYKLVQDLTDRKFAGIVAAATFALNANMLYMQATPMTESLLFCLTTAMVYYVQRWAGTGRYEYLVAGGVFSLFASLSRYESWIILAALVPAVILIAWLRAGNMAPKLRRASILDHSIVFVVIGGAGIVGWLVWNWAISANPIYFQDGQFGKPGLWVSNTNAVVGHLWISIKTYWYAMTDDETLPLLAIAVIGLIIFLTMEWRNRRDFSRSLPVLSLLTIAPFYVYSLYKGQRPLDVPQITHTFYNVRFGLMMLLPTAIFVGYFVAFFDRVLRFKSTMYFVGGALFILTMLVTRSLIVDHEIVTYNESVSYLQSTGTVEEEQVIAFLDHGYHGGRVLMESYGNERIAFALPSNELVYEGSYRQWLPALRDPAGNDIQWIVMDCRANDQDLVCSALTKQQLASYRIVYSTHDHVYRVYERKV
ncbi:MAG: glycosyltransferase [Streptosporangiaceae bacterium]